MSTLSAIAAHHEPKFQLHLIDSEAEAIHALNEVSNLTQKCSGSTGEICHPIRPHIYQAQRALFESIAEAYDGTLTYTFIDAQ